MKNNFKESHNGHSIGVLNKFHSRLRQSVPADTKKGDSFLETLHFSGHRRPVAIPGCLARNDQYLFR